MKIFSTLTIALLIIFQAVGFAATETFSASGEYTMSDYDTPEIAELRALDYARRNAAEQAGIYLESYSRSANFKLEADEIKTVASDNIKILDEPTIGRELLPGDVVKIRVDIKATVDTEALDAAVKKSKDERQQAINQYEDLQKRTRQLDEDIAAFQTKLAAIKDEVKDDDLLVEQERIDREFLSKQVTTNFREAIKINPKNFQAYTFRSFLLESNPAKIKTVNKSIILNPDYGLRSCIHRRFSKV